MADLVMTSPLQVLEGPDGKIAQGRAGVTITAGQLVYYENRSGRYLLADANLSADAAEVEGVALNGCGPGQSIRIQTEGSVTLGAVAAPVVGAAYFLSATGGGIAPAADLVPGWYRTFIGIGGPDNTLVMGIFVSGILG